MGKARGQGCSPRFCRAFRLRACRFTGDDARSEEMALTMAAKTLSCVSCGAVNPGDRPRCDECGATLEAMVPLTAGRSATGVETPTFSIGWFVGSIVAHAVLLAVLIVGLPFVVRTYDPQGFPGIAIGFAVWFVVGLVFGRIAPYRIYFESFFAATITAALIIPYIAHISDVRALEWGSYWLAGFIGADLAWLGAYFGERRPAPDAVRVPAGSASSAR
jgi:hypothetical protein